MSDAVKRVCDIIQQEMGLENDQVYLWDQKINVPNDLRLYVAVAVITAKPFANLNRTFQDEETGQYVEQQTVNMQATLQIDVHSRSPLARDRKEEILMALNSTLAQQYQEAEGFYIARIPTAFVNLSEIEGAAIPYRFNISVAIQYKVSKTKCLPFYDTFQDATLVTDP